MAFWRVIGTLTYPGGVAARDAGLVRARAALQGDGLKQDIAMAVERDGVPQVTVDANYGSRRGPALAWLALMRAEIAGGATGEGNVHLCPHDDPPDLWYDCAGSQAQMERL